MASDTDPGIGVGTPSTGTGPVETVLCPNYPETYLSIEEYWQTLQINENAGYGIRNYPTTGVTGLGCGDYWDYKNRYWLLWAIAKSEKRLEADRWLGFPIRRKYEQPRQLDWSWPVTLGKYVRGIGVEAESDVQLSQAITLSTGGVIHDPVEFTVTVDFTDEDELVIYFPGTSCKIRPSSVSISSTTATVQIPRARLLRPEYHLNYVNDNERPNYTDDSYFLDSVDVKRNYLNTSTGANIVWWRHKGHILCYADVDIFACEPGSACSDVKQLACGYIRNQRLGEVTFEPATYNGGWSKSNFAVRRDPDGLEVNYMRFRYDRYEAIDEDVTRAVIAVAHNNLPRNYCSCDQQSLYYEDDVRPVEPPVRLGLGRSTWGLYYAEQIIREADAKHHPYRGGML
jgi:hypothetical protein